MNIDYLFLANVSSSAILHTTYVNISDLLDKDLKSCVSVPNINNKPQVVRIPYFNMKINYLIPGGDKFYVHVYTNNSCPTGKRTDTMIYQWNPGYR